MDKFDESVVNVDVHLDAAFQNTKTAMCSGGVNFKLSVV